MDSIPKLQKLKVIYSDVDGTFVNAGCLFRNKRQFSLENARAIFRLHQAGVDLVMTSGREKDKLFETARLLGLQNYIANLGMEIVYHRGEKLITNYGFDVPDAATLKKQIKATGVAEALFARFPGKVQFYFPWENYLRTHHLLIGELDFPEAVQWMTQNFPELRIIDNGAVPAQNEFRAPHAYHIVPTNVGKKAAVRIDKKERGLKTESLVGIGDSMEDVTIADEVAVFFLLDETVPAEKGNVIRIPNRDGEGFSRIIQQLEENGHL